MILRSISMNNVRQFTSPVIVDDIGPGLNVLAAANESGKSTLFDALHALFFKKASSRGKEIRSLVPHAGGDPEITVEIEHEGAVYSITKVFARSSGKRSVKVWRDGRLFRQQQEAEDWLLGVMKPPSDGGPAGLLWVRQGGNDLDEGHARAARKTLMASVSGEVEAITGGRRMDSILSSVSRELERYLTPSRDKSKTNGPLWSAEQDVKALEEKRDVLKEAADDLGRLLERRRILLKEKARFEDREEAGKLQDDLEKAKAAYQAAREHDRRLSEASQKARSARLELDSHQTRIAALEASLKEYEEAAEETGRLRAALAEKQQALSKAEAALSDAREKEQALARARDEASQMVRAIEDARAAREARQRRKELLERLEQAQGLHDSIIRLEARVARGPSDKLMKRLEAAWEKLSVARQALNAAAAAITISPHKGKEDSFRLDGAPVAPGVRLPLPRGGEVEVKGVGVIHVHPARVGEGDDTGALEEAFGKALARAGFASLEEARKARRACETAAEEARLARGKMHILVPDGLDALRTRIAALPDAPRKDAPLPSLSRAREKLDEANRAHARAIAGLEKAQAAFEAARRDGAVAGAALASANGRLERARGKLDDPETSKARLSALMAKTPELEARHQAASEALRALDGRAPAVDLDTARARRDRLESAIGQMQGRLGEIDVDLAGLNGRISRRGQAREWKRSWRKPAVSWRRPGRGWRTSASRWMS